MSQRVGRYLRLYSDSDSFPDFTPVVPPATAVGRPFVSFVTRTFGTFLTGCIKRRKECRPWNSSLR